MMLKVHSILPITGSFQLLLNRVDDRNGDHRSVSIDFRCSLATDRVGLWEISTLSQERVAT